MKQLIKTTLCAAMFLSGSCAIAGNDMSTTPQTMQDCVAKHTAKDSNMSKDDIKKACKAQMKDSGNSSTAANAPNPTTTTTKGAPAPSTGSQTTPPQ